VGEADLEATYRAYIAVLNDRRFGELDGYVHDQIAYNDEPMTRQEYGHLLAGDVRAIPDLKYQIQALVIQGDQVACRLWFDCTPEREFLGLEPTGARVAFAEHVFYEFDDGRIRRVRSLINRSAVERQLQRPVGPDSAR
jgi:predicted ester cyclase